MSDNSAPSGATVAQDTVVTLGEQPAPAPAPKPAPEGEPAWLPQRLERERTKVLKDLGIDNLEDGKKAILALRQQEEAKKTAEQRIAELESSFKTLKTVNETQAQALGAYAAAQMSALTDAQRSAVAAIAGDDPAQQLKTISALSSTWTSAAAPAAPTPAPAPAPVADTAPAPSAPKDTGNASSPADPKAVYQELLKTNPIIAARYAIANGIFKQ